jgi:uncharacterized protein YwqG
MRATSRAPWRTGTLYVFYDAIEQPWGFRPSDRTGWRVWHDTTDPSQLERAPFPTDLKNEARFRAHALEYTVETTLPDTDAIAVERLALTKAEDDALARLHEETDRTPPPLHWLLGHPEQIQGEMQLEAQLTSHGIDTGDPAGYKDPRVEGLRAGATDWRLLLQIDSNDEMMWGDEGTIYFWIPVTSLRAGRFDDVRAILQCG